MLDGTIGQRHIRRHARAVTCALAVTATLLCSCLLGCDDDPTQPPAPTTYQDTTSSQILMIGNSLSLWHSAHGLLEALADTSGLDLYLRRALYSGHDLQAICERTDVFQRIKERHWDFVIIQGSDYEVGFPHLHAQMLPPIQQLADSVRINDPDTRIVYYLDYALIEGITVEGTTYTEAVYQRMVRDGTLTIAEQMDFMVAPIGVAWATVRAERPDIDLVDWDGYHPSASSAYLMGCIYYSTIFGRSTEGIAVNGELSGVQAAYLQRVASATVLDSMELWGVVSGR